MKRKLKKKTTKKVKDTYFYIAIAICYMTGIKPEELIALNISDLHFDQDLEFYYVTIHKRISEKGKEEYYEGKELEQKVRSIPLLSPLSDMIKKVMEKNCQYYGLNEEEIMEAAKQKVFPLFPDYSKKLKNRRKAKYNRRNVADIKKIEDIVPNAGKVKRYYDLSLDKDGENKVIDDEKRSGIMRSNFKYYATNVAELTEGEVSYMLGVKAGNTYNRNYCDYSEPGLLLEIGKNLQKWWMKEFSEYSSECEARKVTVKIGEKKYQKYVKPYNGYLSADIDFEIDSTRKKSSKIEIKSQFGCSGDIQIMDKE